MLKMCTETWTELNNAVEHIYALMNVSMFLLNAVYEICKQEDIAVDMVKVISLEKKLEKMINIIRDIPLE